MAAELKWSKRERDRQVKLAHEYIGAFGGPIANKKGAMLQAATYTDLHDVFVSIDKDNSGTIDMKEFQDAAGRLGFPVLNQDELRAKFTSIAKGSKTISEAQFIDWWNNTNSKKVDDRLRRTMTLTATSEIAIDQSNAAAKVEKAVNKVKPP